MRLKLILLVVLLLSPMVLADDTFKKSEDFLISQPVTLDGGIDPTLEVNVSFFSPNNTLLVPWTTMSFNSGSSEYELLVSLENFTDSGRYCAFFSATNGSLSESTKKCYVINTIGRDFGEEGGLGALALMAGTLGVAFFFMIFSFKFAQGDGTRPLGLFFGILAIIMVIYSLQLGLSYSIALFDYDPFSSSHSSIYVSALYLLSGIGIISFILMTIGIVREFGKGAMMKNYGAGFDPITKTYG